MSAAASPAEVSRSGADIRVSPAMRRGPVLGPFAAFCGYAVLRWQTMLPGVWWRLLAMLAVAWLISFISVGRPPSARSRPWWAVAAGRQPLLRRGSAAAAVLLAAIAMLALCGMPLSWLTHLRIALLADTIGHGIDALPAVTVPYRGRSAATAMTIALSAGALMLVSGLLLRGVCGAGELSAAARQRRLGAAAAPLVLMALIPSLIVAPHYALLHGAVVFVLLVMLVYGWRVERGRGLGAAALLAVAVAAGSLLAGAVHPPHGLFYVSRIVSSLGPARPVAFDWSQTYGPLEQSGGSEVVLEIRARHPAYWKAEDLDVFNGTAWAAGPSPLVTGISQPAPLLGVSRANRRRWTQTLQVTDTAMGTDELIAAGTAQMPILDRLLPGVLPGSGAGTWVLSAPMTPGLRYSVRVYTPEPTPKQLSVLAPRYPAAIRAADLSIGGYSEPALLPVWALARRLAAGVDTPYEYVQAIYAYLHRGFVYVRDPPRSSDPIPDFLLRTKRGYCQQFAGAMALLLRMGGVPARVVVGFSTGSYDAHSHLYQVAARDAHAWVEVWFPRYGWVTFDPTAAADNAPKPTHVPATGAVPAQPVHGPAHPVKALGGPRAAKPVTSVAAPHVTHGSTFPALQMMIAALALLIAFALVIWLLLAGGVTSFDPERLTAELEHACARCGRPLAGGMTLAQLEALAAQKSPEAAAYIASVRLARFGPASVIEGLGQRRALRRWLSSGRGPYVHIKALIALPPRHVPGAGRRPAR